MYTQGKIDVHSGKIDVHSGMIDVNSGKIDVHSGKIDVHSANVASHTHFTKIAISLVWMRIFENGFLHLNVECHGYLCMNLWICRTCTF